MKIKEIRALRGPNYYNQLPVILMELDIEELEEKPTDLVNNFKENIEKVLPSLYYHTCSEEVKGGFFERIKRGTWAGHVLEHVAIELQNLIGHKISYGKTITLKEKGNYIVVYRYINEEVGIKAGEMAFEIVDNLFKNKLTDIEPMLEELKVVYESTLLGTSTRSIVDEATKRGINHIRLNKHNYIQLGEGKYQRKIEATVMDNTSSIGVDIAKDKERTKQILEENGIPVPRGKAVNTYESAFEVVDSIGYPVVVKPLSGNHGRGITIDINDNKELEIAVKVAKEISNYIVVEKYIEGFDFRILVIDGKFVAASLREPAYIIGDGKSTIKELIDKINSNPNRGEGHEKVLTKIDINKETERALRIQKLNLNSVIGSGEKIYIKNTGNLSSGGTAIDVTDKVCIENKVISERISKIIGLNIIGIDVMAKSLETPLKMDSDGIIEVNAGPGFRMHLHPCEGTPRNVGKAVVDMLFPKGTRHSLPRCAITGTNGKTTTTRLISHIISGTGKIVGMTSTDEVVVNKRAILKGDYSGPGGAEAVIRDNTVEHAVLEVARGGIIRRGLGFKECDVGVLLNVSSDHLGFGGIDTLEELARVKSTVIESVKKDGYAIVNGDDQLTYSRLDKVKANIIFISKDKDNENLKRNLEKGNFNVTIKDGNITIQKENEYIDVEKVVNIPITFKGKATFNIENAMAAVAASYASGIEIEKIRQGLLSFNTSAKQSSGRMNVIDIGNIKVVIDYGHNIGAIKATGEFLRQLMPGRKIRMTSGVGNRRTEDIVQYGYEISKYFDYVVITDPSSRIRKLGETAELVKEGLVKGGLKESQIDIILEEREATLKTLQQAKPGDLVVLQVEDIKQVTSDVLEFKKNYFKNLNKFARFSLLSEFEEVDNFELEVL